MDNGVIVSPFSNSEIRNWPADRYAAFIGLLLERLPVDEPVHVVGTATQRLAACEVVRPHPATRVFNQCGRWSWPQLVEALRRATLIVGNNSGVAHLGGYFGRPTVCVFGGSHQRAEWRPRGPGVVLVSRAIGCSPCHLDHNIASIYDKACLRRIEPERVADAAMLARARMAGATAMRGPADDGRPLQVGSGAA